MRHYLLFRLFGPLAAWGDIAVGEHRPSAAYPTKSAIVGLVAAAFGIRREEEDRHRSLAQGYGLGLRVDATGELLRDYHTVQVPPARKGVRHHTRRDELSVADLYTILSQRDYRAEAHYTVALWSNHSAPYSLEEIADALRRPRFVLYLGRKACPPALPLAPLLHEAATLREAFGAYTVDAELLAGFRWDESPRLYWEGLTAQEAGFRDRLTSHRRDLPLSRQRWQFRSREEHQGLDSGGKTP